ncbi:MAG TPA: hypothetical protein VG938_00980 [Verrucomicrobiae bacterium]|jgi:hypothetical protein|nr:hypothetical protein [Verrucomicrobiae bacterium]
MKEKRIKWTILVFALLLLALGVFSLSTARGLGVLTADDSFYYFRTAQHIVAGDGSTFDGINFSNGYHPLWMTILLPIFWFAHGNSDLALRLVYALLSLILAGSMILYWSFLKKKCGAFAATAILPFFAAPIVLNQFTNGLESGLLILVLGILLCAVDHWDLLPPQNGPARKAALGFLLALLFLCRLDTAFILIGVAVATCLFYKVRFWRPAGIANALKSYWLVLVVFVVLVSPYLMWNHKHTGHLVPISGALKSSFPHVEGSILRAIRPQWAPYSVIIIAFTLFALVSIFLPAGFLRKQLQPGVKADSGIVMLLGIGIGALLHFTYSVCFTTWGTFSWHFASYIPLLLFMAASVFAWLKFKGWRWVGGALSAAVLVLSVIGTCWGLSVKKQVHDMWYVSATWARENTPENATFGMTDCGYFAYFSHRRTVNLDGLINGYEYQHALTSGDLPNYFAHCHLDYVCDYEVAANGRPQHFVHLNRILDKEYRKGKRGYDIQLAKNEALYTSPEYTEYNGRPIQFMIWKYEPQELFEVTSQSDSVTSYATGKL